MKRLIITIIIVIITARSVHAEEKKVVPGPSFHDQVVATYNFLPRNLDPKAINAKSKKLDAFWAQVKDRGPQGLEELRTELRRTDAPVFFNYDGAKLLLSLSKTREDQGMALTAINRAELRDIQWDDYF